MAPTIRLATEHDAPGLARLLRAEDIAELIDAPLGHHYLLVAEDPRGEIAAVAVLRLQPARAELRLLVLDPDHDSRELEELMIQSARTLSTACGCTQFDQSHAFREN